ncbi:MAG: DM13 domain-containing protein [Hyphomicrobium sp.]|uniref:DM13 domain-containing protein n=1 Tax=Hyphomicrobium sp. TaxID=82 RepID=UPI003D095CB8
MVRWIFLLASHGLALCAGFALGVYTLPLLTEPAGPDQAELHDTAARAIYTGRFERNLKGSDLLHWGEGEVRVLPDKVAHIGRLSPGPDYKLYLAGEFVDTKEDFLRIKDKALRIGDVKTFNGFLLPVPPGADVGTYTTVVVWCEAFSQFISAAKYR